MLPITVRCGPCTERGAPHIRAVNAVRARAYPDARKVHPTNKCFFLVPEGHAHCAFVLLTQRLCKCVRQIDGSYYENAPLKILTLVGVSIWPSLRHTI